MADRGDLDPALRGTKKAQRLSPGRLCLSKGNACFAYILTSSVSAFIPISLFSLYHHHARSPGYRQHVRRGLGRPAIAIHTLQVEISHRQDVRYSLSKTALYPPRLPFYDPHRRRIFYKIIRWFTLTLTRSHTSTVSVPQPQHSPFYRRVLAMGARSADAKFSRQPQTRNSIHHLMAFSRLE